MASIFRSAALRRDLYFVTPAASSMRHAPVLGLGGDDEPDPALLDDGVGAGADAGAEEELDDVQRRQVVLLMRYSDSPERKRRRVTVISA